MSALGRYVSEKIIALEKLTITGKFSDEGVKGFVSESCRDTTRTSVSDRNMSLQKAKFTAYRYHEPEIHSLTPFAKLLNRYPTLKDMQLDCYQQRSPRQVLLPPTLPFRLLPMVPGYIRRRRILASKNCSRNASPCSKKAMADSRDDDGNKRSDGVNKNKDDSEQN
mmetsp:Transcript_10131/g.21245  ORF Transcript_10131/g.21245 Transcript_10131/m.21245 type:complete len:166 (+) Transcript_10131:178-675(+)